MAYLQGEGEKRQEWGVTTVIMAKRGNPCPKCLPFVGKVLIDDVWSGGPERWCGSGDREAVSSDEFMPSAKGCIIRDARTATLHISLVSPLQMIPGQRKN